MSSALRTAIGSVLAGATLLWAGAASALAQPDLSDWSIAHEQSSHGLGASAEIYIINPWGAVNLRVAEGDEVVISTASQRHRDDPRQPVVDVEDTPSGLKIEVRFDDRLDVEEALDWQNRRIDIGVSVPETLALSIRTEEDDIDVRDLVGRADLESKSGDIRFRGPGELRARSDSGSIFAQFHRSDWPDPVSLETRTGDIRAEFLEGASATAEIETRGPITTDFSLTIERSSGSRLKRGVATAGAGGQTLRLKSNSGAVRLVAVIVPEKKNSQHPIRPE